MSELTEPNRSNQQHDESELMSEIINQAFKRMIRLFVGLLRWTVIMIIMFILLIALINIFFESDHAIQAIIETRSYFDNKRPVLMELIETDIPSNLIFVNENQYGYKVNDKLIKVSRTADRVEPSDENAIQPLTMEQWDFLHKTTNKAITQDNMVILFNTNTPDCRIYIQDVFYRHCSDTVDIEGRICIINTQNQLKWQSSSSNPSAFNFFIWYWLKTTIFHTESGLPFIYNLEGPIYGMIVQNKCPLPR